CSPSPPLPGTSLRNLPRGLRRVESSTLSVNCSNWGRPYRPGWSYRELARKACASRGEAEAESLRQPRRSRGGKLAPAEAKPRRKARARPASLILVAARPPACYENRAMTSYAILTFGCQMNVHDSERMHEVLRRAGYAEAEATSADVIVLNTCSVREKAEQKLRSEVGRLAKQKRGRREPILVVPGWVAPPDGQP